MRKLMAAIGVIAYFGSLPTQAITIDPNEYFAYSKPYQGGVQAFLSHQACPIPKKGIEPDWLERYDVQEKTSQARWKKSLQYIPQLPGTMPSCWVEIKKGQEQGVLICIQREGKLDTCTAIAQTYFFDTADLPKAPSRPRF